MDTGLLPISCFKSYLKIIKKRKGNMQDGRISHITSSSSFVKNVMAVPCFPARPVRPYIEFRQHALSMKQDILTNTMNISFYCACHLEIYDKTDVLYIYTSSREIRRNQNVSVSFPKSGQRCFTLFLVFA